MRPFIMAILGVLMTHMAALGFEPMNAKIRMSNEALYDYVIIGEQPLATDSYDNAYDTISPGNLNADMGEPFISVVSFHPELKKGMEELRGDIKSLAKHKEWRVVISASLPKGTPLKVELETDETELPKGMRLILKEQTTGKTWDIATMPYMLPAPGLGKKSEIVIIAEQP